MLGGPSPAPLETAELFQALARSPDPVFATDRRLRIIFWNPSCQSLLGYSAEEMVGLSCSRALSGCDVFGNRYCSEHCPVTEIAARDETVRHFGLGLRAKDGHVVTVDVSILHLTIRPPDHFVLAHILKPGEHGAARTAADPTPERPPQSPLAAARESPDARVRQLTAREVEVLAMLAAGRSTPEIAERLHISTLTARNHIQNVLEKLEVHSKTEAVAFAFQQRIL
ncbi:MAG: LuxR C-terminal-related transcriptional regulator [Acidobacteriota bacterium]